MKLLAIDTSGLTASAAILTEEKLIAEYTVDYKKTHSQTLLPMIAEIVKMTETELSSLDAIAVAAGPGSFTGLRIGSATAKGLGFALEKPIISVPTTAAMAYDLWGCGTKICPLMDARRNQVYTGLYEMRDGRFSTCWEQMAIDVSDLADRLNDLGESVTFLGDGVPVYRDVLEQKLKILHYYVPPHLARQRAAAVGALALTYGKEKWEDAAAHVPVYLRPAQAEWDREQRLKREALEEQGKE